MWANQTKQRVRPVIVITMVEKNDVIFNRALTYCHFIIMDNTYVGKQNHTKGSSTVVITMVKQNDIIFNHGLTYCCFMHMDNT